MGLRSSSPRHHRPRVLASSAAPTVGDQDGREEIPELQRPVATARPNAPPAEQHQALAAVVPRTRQRRPACAFLAHLAHLARPRLTTAPIARTRGPSQSPRSLPAQSAPVHPRRAPLKSLALCLAPVALPATSVDRRAAADPPVPPRAAGQPTLHVEVVDVQHAIDHRELELEELHRARPPGPAPKTSATSCSLQVARRTASRAHLVT